MAAWLSCSGGRLVDEVGAGLEDLLQRRAHLRGERVQEDVQVDDAARLRRGERASVGDRPAGAVQGQADEAVGHAGQAELADRGPTSPAWTGVMLVSVMSSSTSARPLFASLTEPTDPT